MKTCVLVAAVLAVAVSLESRREMLMALNGAYVDIFNLISNI